MNNTNHEPNQNDAIPLLNIGWLIMGIAAVVRFFAKPLTWPSLAVWGAQVEATSFYARQRAVEDISVVFMAFGLSLVFIHILIGRLAMLISKNAKQAGASDDNEPPI